MILTPMNLTISSVSLADIECLVPRARPIDRKEWALLRAGMPLIEHVKLAVTQSIRSRVLQVDGAAQIIWGFAARESYGYQPWALGSDWPLTHAKSFWKVSRAELPSGVYMENIVLQENVCAQRWLKRLGFTLLPKTFRLEGYEWKKFKKGP